MIYLTSVIGFGLLQIWILLGFLTFKQVNYSTWDLVKDGGLFIFVFFFSITTFIHHRKIFKRVHANETYWSFFFMFLIMFFCFLGFSSSIEINKDKTSFEIIQNTLQNSTQIGCSVFAVFYGYLVEKRLERAIR